MTQTTLQSAYTGLAFLLCVCKLSTVVGNDCLDYRSCESQTLSGSEETNCYGSHSCISATISSTFEGDTIRCSGFASCANTDMKSLGAVEADGEFALFGSNVVWDSVDDTSHYIFEVRAHRALANAHVIVASWPQKFSLAAFMSAPGSIIRSNKTAVDFTIVGGKAGRNATIICENEDHCYLQCWGDGCNELTLVGSFRDIECRYDAEFSAVCPEGRKFNDFIAESMQIVDTFGSPTLPYTYDPNAEECVEDGVTGICDESYTCNVDFESSGIDSVCCLAVETCDAWDVGGQTLYCDAQDGCRQKISAADQLFMRGDGVARYADAFIGYSAYCTAMHSCADVKDITLTENLHCYGRFSCGQAVVNSVNNIYVVAEYAATTVTVLSAQGSIFCNSKQACQGATIANVADSVYSKGYRGLVNSDVQNVTNTIAAFGYLAMESAFVFNASELYCDGTYCLQSSTVQTVSTIKVDGTDALVGAEIESDLGGQDFIIEIYDDNSEGYQVTCSQEDECYIGCYSAAACLYMNLTCDGICEVDCAENAGIACPIGVNVTINLTITSTSIPSTTYLTTLQTSTMSEDFDLTQAQMTTGSRDVGQDESVGAEDNNKDSVPWWPYAAACGAGALCLAGGAVVCLQCRKHKKKISERESDLKTLGEVTSAGSKVSETQMASGVPETAGKESNGTMSPQSFGERNVVYHDNNKANVGKEPLVFGDIGVGQGHVHATAGVTAGEDPRATSQAHGEKPTDVTKKSVEIVGDQDDHGEGLTLG